jgi:hypothetical protein
MFQYTKPIGVICVLLQILCERIVHVSTDATIQSTYISLMTAHKILLKNPLSFIIIIINIIIIIIITTTTIIIIIISLYILRISLNFSSFSNLIKILHLVTQCSELQIILYYSGWSCFSCTCTQL